MAFGRKKESAIDKRLRDLRKEIERVQGELKQAARPGPEPAQPMTTPRLRDKTAAPADSSNAGDLFSHASRKSVAHTQQADGREADQPDLFDPPPTLDLSVRRKFASYFMAGHFPNLRPRRQERRIIRNKALLMTGLALLALWVLWWFLRR